MKRFIKSVLVAGGMAAVGFQGYKSYRLFIIAKKAREELPLFVEEKYGEKPQVGFSLSVNLVVQMQLKLTFSPESLKENPDREENLKADVLEIYPQFKKCHFQFMVVDSSMSKIDIIKKYNPKIYAKFGKLIEKKLQENQATEAHEEPTD